MDKKGGDADKAFLLHIERLKRGYENRKSKANGEKKPLEISEDVRVEYSSENEAEAEATLKTNTSQTDSNQVTKPNMMKEALTLAKKGFRVFPVYEPAAKGCACKQGEFCSNAGKHPRVLEWQKVATTNEKQIKDFWQKWQSANIGIATGKGSNVIVLDVDANKGGNDSFQELFKDLAFPETLTAQTGNGYHLFFETVEGFEIKNSVVKIGEGLDIRGENGFVVASPSLHRNGKRYSWMNDIKPCPLPEHLKEKLIEIERQKSTQVVDSKEVSQISKSKFSNTNTSIIPESIRNETLFRKASALRGKGKNESEILEKLREVNQTQCVPQMEETELQKIAHSVMRYQSEKQKRDLNTSVSASV